MDHNQKPGQVAGFIRKGVHAEQRVQEDQNQGIGSALGNVIPQQQLFGKVTGLVQLLGAHTAPHHSDHGKADGLAHNAAHAVQVVGHRIGGNMHRAEQRDHADDQHTPQLEQAVFQRGGDADIQNVLCHLGLQVLDAIPGNAGDIIMPGGQFQDDDSAQHAGNQRGHRNTGNPHAQHKNAERIAHNIGNVHDNGYPHGYLAVADGAEDGRARVVQRQKRVRDCRDGKVDHGCLEHIVRNAAKEQPQHGPAQQQAERHDSRTQDSA